MANELDSTNGHVSFANSRSDAWHRLGQSVGHSLHRDECFASTTQGAGGFKVGPRLTGERIEQRAGFLVLHRFVLVPTTPSTLGSPVMGLVRTVANWSGTASGAGVVTLSATCVTFSR